MVCRLCKKNLTAFGSRLPRVSLFTVLRNKELVTAPQRTVELHTLFQRMGFPLQRGKNYSELCCLSCARKTVRCYNLFVSITEHCNKCNDTTDQDNSTSVSTLRSPKARPKRTVFTHSPTGVSPKVKKCKPISKRALNFDAGTQNESMEFMDNSEAASTSSCVVIEHSGDGTVETTAKNKQSAKDDMTFDDRMKGVMDLSGTATIVKVI